MDLLDVVTADDKVIGQATKDVCHSQGLRHRSVFVFIFERDNRLVLQQRSARKDVRPGKITASACGHVLAGESYAAAAVRELQEELGISSPLTPVLKTEGPYSDDREIITLFVGSYDGSFQPNDQEIDHLIAMSVEDVSAALSRREMNFGESFRKVFEEYRTISCFRA